MISLSPIDLSWRQADETVHVATVTDEYAGFIDGTADGFQAHGSRGEDLGLHRTSARARAAVAAFVASRALSARPGPRSLPRTAAARRRRRTR